MIYLASPYWHFEASVREHRVKQNIKCMETLLKQGGFVYSPLLHSRGIEGVGEAFWAAHSLKMLAICDTLFVLRLENWLDSTGLENEISWWKKHRNYSPRYIAEEDITIVRLYE